MRGTGSPHLVRFTGASRLLMSAPARTDYGVTLCTGGGKNTSDPINRPACDQGKRPRHCPRRTRAPPKQSQNQIIERTGASHTAADGQRVFSTTPGGVPRPLRAWSAQKRPNCPRSTKITCPLPRHTTQHIGQNQTQALCLRALARKSSLWMIMWDS